MNEGLPRHASPVWRIDIYLQLNEWARYHCVLSTFQHITRGTPIIGFEYWSCWAELWPSTNVLTTKRPFYTSVPVTAISINRTIILKLMTALADRFCIESPEAPSTYSSTKPSFGMEPLNTMYIVRGRIGWSGTFRKECILARWPPETVWLAVCHGVPTTWCSLHQPLFVQTLRYQK